MNKYRKTFSAFLLAAALCLVLITANQQIAVKADFTTPYYFANGFEEGDFSAWSSASPPNPNIQNGGVASIYSSSYSTSARMAPMPSKLYLGLYSAEFDTPANVTSICRAYVKYSPAAGTTELYAREYWLINNTAGWPTASKAGILDVRDSSSNIQGSIRLYNDGASGIHFHVTSYNGSQGMNQELYNNTNIVVQTNHWYYLELHVKTGNGTGLVEAKIDNQTVYSLKNLYNAWFTSSINIIRFGGSYVSYVNASTAQCVDEVVISNNWIGTYLQNLPFYNGFEEGDFSYWTTNAGASNPYKTSGTTASVVYNQTGAIASYAAKFTAPNDPTGADRSYCYYDFRPGIGGTLYAHALFKIDSSSVFNETDARLSLIDFRNSTGPDNSASAKVQGLVYVWHTAPSDIRFGIYENFNGTALQYNSAWYLQYDTWYDIFFKITLSTTAGSLTLYINGSYQGGFSNLNLGTTFGTARFGLSYSYYMHTSTIYMDDCLIEPNYVGYHVDYPPNDPGYGYDHNEIYWSYAAYTGPGWYWNGSRYLTYSPSQWPVAYDPFYDSFVQDNYSASDFNQSFWSSDWGDGLHEWHTDAYPHNYQYTYPFNYTYSSYTMSMTLFFASYSGIQFNPNNGLNSAASRVTQFRFWLWNESFVYVNGSPVVVPGEPYAWSPPIQLQEGWHTYTWTWNYCPWTGLPWRADLNNGIAAPDDSVDWLNGYFTFTNSAEVVVLISTYLGVFRN